MTTGPLAGDASGDRGLIEEVLLREVLMFGLRIRGANVDRPVILGDNGGISRLVSLCIPYPFSLPFPFPFPKLLASLPVRSSELSQTGTLAEKLKTGKSN